MSITKAVIMARGLGTRMRQADDGANLTTEQARIAGSGVKGLLPVGRAFLEYSLSALADAGYQEICLVIGPEHGVLREHITRLNPKRFQVILAIQDEPRGTADAVLAAAPFAGSDDFVVLNSDNYYPVQALQALRMLEGPGVAAFSARALIKDSGIPAPRVGSFPAVHTDGDDWLTGLTSQTGLRDDAWISMNCWRLSPRIFEACRTIAPSPRDELELPDAIMRSITQGEKYRVLRFDRAVLDVSTRSDIGRVAAQLRDIPVNL